jgi:hypothetical protein
MENDFNLYKSGLTEINCYSQDMASVFQWFRDTHNLYPVVKKRNDFLSNYFYRIVDWNKPSGETILFDSDPKYGFAEARNLVLIKLIEIVKSRKNK